MTMPSAFPSQFAGSFGGDGAGSAQCAAYSSAGTASYVAGQLNWTQGAMSGQITAGDPEEGQAAWSPNVMFQPPQSQGATLPAQAPGNQINAGAGGAFAAAQPSGTALGGGMGQDPLPQGQPASLTPHQPQTYSYRYPAPVTGAKTVISGQMETGLKFTANQAGTITGLAFLKTPTDTTTTRSLTVWNAAGAAIGSVITTGEPVGTEQWIYAALATPVAIAAGQVFTISYSTPAAGKFEYLTGQPALPQIAGALTITASVYNMAAGVFPATTDPAGTMEVADLTFVS